MTAVLAEEAADAHQENDQGGREQGPDQPGQEVGVPSFRVVIMADIRACPGEQASTKERVALKHRNIVGVEERNGTGQIVEREVEGTQRRQCRELGRNRPRQLVVRHVEEVEIWNVLHLCWNFSSQTVVTHVQ